jgi:hypothetical protein
MYRRASVSLGASTGLYPSFTLPPICCIVIDSSEFTKVLETVFNHTNGSPIRDADLQQKILDIARRGPELCLVLNQRGNELDIWCIDVRSMKSSQMSLTSQASGLQEWEASQHIQNKSAKVISRVDEPLFWIFAILGVLCWISRFCWYECLLHDI